MQSEDTFTRFFPHKELSADNRHGSFAHLASPTKTAMSSVQRNLRKWTAQDLEKSVSKPCIKTQIPMATISQPKEQRSTSTTKQEIAEFFHECTARHQKTINVLPYQMEEQARQETPKLQNLNFKLITTDCSPSYDENPTATLSRDAESASSSSCSEEQSDGECIDFPSDFQISTESLPQTLNGNNNLAV